MNPSNFILLAGLVCLCIGAFLVGTIFGFFFTGFALVVLAALAEAGNRK